MRISLIQSDIQWEHKAANLLFYESMLSGLTGKTDLVVLPEMCTTGFSMHPEKLAETNQGETLSAFRRMAAAYRFAIAGSFVAADGTDCYNRAFFVRPDGCCDFYDKRHLFRMGDESSHYKSGREKGIVEYMGWHIRLAVCYDLRFPVWLRNVDNEYDLLLVVANWPESRQHVWNSLLVARALENQAFVCGVNRVGTDANGIVYAGGSVLINAYGAVVAETQNARVDSITAELNPDELKRFRERFPVWKDADSFELISSFD